MNRMSTSACATPSGNARTPATSPITADSPATSPHVCRGVSPSDPEHRVLPAALHLDRHQRVQDPDEGDEDREGAQDVRHGEGPVEDPERRLPQGPVGADQDRPVARDLPDPPDRGVERGPGQEPDPDRIHTPVVPEPFVGFAEDPHQPLVRAVVVIDARHGELPLSPIGAQAHRVPLRNPCRYAYGSETMTAPPRIASQAVWASPSRKRKASNDLPGDPHHEQLGEPRRGLEGHAG